MTEDVKRRLQRLRDDLAELVEMPGARCGFGLFSFCDDAGVRLQHPNSWKFLASHVSNARRNEGHIRPEPSPWFDPFPSGTACIRWWGDVDRAKAFQEWAGRASAILRKHLRLPEGIEIEAGYYGTLRAFVHLACGDAQLSKLVSRVSILDVGTLPSEGRRMLPTSLKDIDTPFVIAFDDVRGWGDRFALRVLETLLGETVRRPRLVVDVEKGTVTLDDGATVFNDVFARILNQLLKAQGRPVSRSEMQGADSILKDYKRLDRDIKSLKTKLKIDVKSSRKGYYLPEDYVA